MESSCPSLFVLAALLLTGGASAAPPEIALPDLSLSSSLPITLDADSSEFDRLNDRLLFKGLRISQGSLGIVADSAEASRLDFKDNLWTFRGNVVIESGNTRAWSDEATIRFRDHQMSKAELRGGPAHFEQRRVESDSIAEGRADIIQYDLTEGTIRMLDNAWLSDGANEVSGSRIAYDLTREYIVADGDDSGQVRMKIIPPEKRTPKAP